MEKNINKFQILFAGNTNYFQKNVKDYDVAEYNLDSDVSELRITTSGIAYILPSGVKIVIPRSIGCNKDKIFCSVTKELNIFKLNPTDQLLSPVVKLTPNGLKFSKLFQVFIPYHYSRSDKQTRELVMRVTTLCTSGVFKYEDLNPELIKTAKEYDNSFSGEAVSFVSNFSLLGIISRLKEDHVVVKKEQSSVLFSFVDPYTKLHFPQNSVINPTDVTITVLAIDNADVKNVVNSDYCPVSNVLQVSVSPKNTVFQTPVMVYLALPNSLIGRSYDKDMLRLLKSSNELEEWQDITTEVKLVYTDENVSFLVDSFSKFWLVWKNVVDIAIKVYQMAITYKVQFLAMQKQSQPSWVLAQCVRHDLVEKRVNQLVEMGYYGKDGCSVVHDFMEGDWFKVKVIGNIQVKSNSEDVKKHLEEKILVKQFLSQYPPDANGLCNFFIEPLDPVSKINIGYISFYKVSNTVCDALENDLYCENGNVFVQKKLHLDDVQVALDHFEKSVQHRSEFGEPERGAFDEATLNNFASDIGAEWQELGYCLGIKHSSIYRIKADNQGNAQQQIFAMLLLWSRTQEHNDESVYKFVNALREVGRNDIAEKVETNFTKKEQNLSQF